MSTDHDRAFFEQMATRREPYRRLADAIHAALGPPLGARRVLDLGAGLGYVPGRLRELGWEAYANDLYAPDDLREPPAEMWRQRGGRWDLTRGAPFGVDYRHDVMICTETAEHIPEAFADTVVLNVAERAERLIVWSAAQPGQEWPGHVNLQPPAYWLGKFYMHGFAPLIVMTATLRAEMVVRHAQHEYAADNFFVLGRST